MKSTASAAVVIVFILLVILGTGLYFLFSDKKNVNEDYVQVGAGVEADGEYGADTIHRIVNARVVIFKTDSNNTNPILDYKGRIAVWSKGKDTYTLIKEDGNSYFNVYPNSMFIMFDPSVEDTVKFDNVR